MKRNILSLAFAVLCAVVTLSSCLGNDNPKPEPLTPEQLRIRHISNCIYRFKMGNPNERYYWIREVKDGQVKHLQKALLRNDTKYYTVIKLDDPSKLPTVDESKGIYAAGKLMEDTKKIIHRGSRPTEKKEDLDAQTSSSTGSSPSIRPYLTARSRSTECPSTSPRRTKSEGSPTPSASGWPSQRTSSS